MEFTGQTLPTAPPNSSMCHCYSSMSYYDNPCSYVSNRYYPAGGEFYLVLQPLQDTLSFTLTVTVEAYVGGSLDLFGIVVLYMIGAGIVALLVGGCLASVCVIGGLVIRKKLRRTAEVAPNHDKYLTVDDL